MSLADELDDISPLRGDRCAIGQILELINADDAEALARAVDDQRKEASQIAAAIRRNYPIYEVDSQSVRRHRRRRNGGCKCPS